MAFTIIRCFECGRKEFTNSGEFRQHYQAEHTTDDG